MCIAVRDEKFSISPPIIVALTVFDRRAFSIAPPAVECILFANRNETVVLGGGTGRGGWQKGQGEGRKIATVARNFIFSRRTIGDNSGADRKVHRVITMTR